MQREIAIQEIKSRIRCNDFLEKSKSGNYCCPFCGSGHGPDKSGAMKYYPDTNTVCCFAAACGKKKYDVIDIYRQLTGADFNEALRELGESIGITIDSYHIPGSKPANTPNTPQNAEIRPQTNETGKMEELSLNGKENGTEAKIQPQNATETNYNPYYRQCWRQLTDKRALDYLESRGISKETAATYMLGFDPEADPASAPGAMGNEYKPHPAPRIICPTSKNHYIARSIDPNNKFKKLNPNSSKGGGPVNIFNRDVLSKPEVTEIFVTEGFFNALSIIEAGAVAISTNSANNVDLLLKEIKRRHTNATMILAFDNDEAGRKATDRMRAGLQKLNIPFIVAGTDVTGKGDADESKEDANDLLCKDREKFKEAIYRTLQKTAARPDNASFYIDNLFTAEIDRFSAGNIKTGFNTLDKLSGGIYSGLYVIAAITSLGKTTFAAQMADQMAEAGNDVLFFSMEQSRLEMVSKSIARQSYILDKKTAETSLQIRKGRFTTNVLEAIDKYKSKVGERISIIEGNYRCDIGYIGDYIRQYMRKTAGENGKARPVVIIDYLQVLQPQQTADRRQGTKELIDSAVIELKRLTRELDITVIVISSVNRANYLTPIDFESMKESGGIEYTADVVWGLQLQCLNESLFETAASNSKITEKRKRIREAKREDPRKIELVCLKNRYGISSYSVYFNYHPQYDYFEESSLNG